MTIPLHKRDHPAIKHRHNHGATKPNDDLRLVFDFAVANGMDANVESFSFGNWMLGKDYLFCCEGY